jgi:nucleoside-diphosphate-sugar epimerase
VSLLITGGAGFLARYLLREPAMKNRKVVVFDRHAPKVEAAPNVVCVAGDIADYGQLEKAIKEHNVDGIVHLSSIMLSEAAASPHEAIRVNVQGTVNVFEAAIKLGLGRVIWASSVQVYGSKSFYYPETWVDETVFKQPVSLYGLCKSFCEDVASFYKSHGLKATGLRFSTIYGYGRKTGSNTYLCDLIEQAARGKDVTIPYAEHNNNLIYVKDAARAVVHCLEAGGKELGETYNICSEQLYTNREIAATLQELLPNVSVRSESGKFGDRATPYTKHTAAERDFGFRIRYPLREALSDFIAEVQASPE